MARAKPPADDHELERLRAEHAFLSSIVEHHPDGIVVLDRSGMFKHINPALQRMVGRPLRSPISMEELAELLVPDPARRAEAFSSWAADLACEHPPPHLLAFRHADGGWRWGRFQQAHLPSGEVLISCVEFTEQKRQELETAEAKERYRALVHASPDAITVTDLEGRIVEVSQRSVEVHGFESAGEMIGLSAFDLIAPELRPHASRNLEEVLRTGWGRLEGEALRKDGSRFLTELTASLVRDASGAPIAFVGVTRDVTRRRLAEQALRESEERYRVLFENAPVGLGLSDADGKIIACNEAILRSIGITREEALALGNVTEIYASPADRERLIAIASEQGGLRQAAVQLRRKDGRPLQALMSLARVHLQGRPCWQSVIEDVDERRRVMHELEARNAELAQANEELARLHRAKDRFVATISHELRTPLVTGIGYLELLLEGGLGKLPPRAQRRMQVALRNLQRLSRLIDDLLQYNRVVQNAQRYTPALQEVDLHELCEECVTELRARTRRGRQSLGLELPAGLPRVQADPELLRTVISNLLDNAATHAGPRSQIRLAAREEAGRVAVSVADDGLGMDAASQERAFDPFYQAGESRAGLGLGLFIVRAIIEAHGSSVRLESEPGKGTVITFSLDTAK